MAEFHFRRHPRARLRLRARVRAQAKGGSAFDCMTRDLGPGGAFLATTVLLDVGTRVTIELSSPFSWEPLRLPAEVRRHAPEGPTEPAGMGLAFVGLQPRQMVALHDLLATLSYGAV